ncbi:MAG: Anthranilate phosphoribosyltransferase, partial [uncultured Chloroflexia bacterium]
MNIQDAIKAIVGSRDLRQDEAALVMEEIMTGEATQAQIAAFLTALHLKGETDAEIAGMAEVMREKAVRVSHTTPVLDTCGTGGDATNTFNISTAAAFVAAGAGVTVAKHGNRAMSSRCGSADVLEGLGVVIDLDAEGVARCLDQAGIGFMFAQKFHPAMRYAGSVRRE